MLQLNEAANILKMKYLPQYHTFDIELIPHGEIVPIIKRLNIRNFPNHSAFKILNDKFQISQEVNIWLKNPEELFKSGWKKKTEKGTTLVHEALPYTIGKHKGQLLGKMGLKGFVGISPKFIPYVVIKAADKYWRFTESELRLILPRNSSSLGGKAAQLHSPHNLAYNPRSATIQTNLGALSAQAVIDLLRKAELI